ncbi:hypothetical protein MKW98_024414 [Papaver atlanticum]|uniref:Uncharacterized protein n=1 Tax=Papaver atlanticum TaxID=357466 RepID=A0AAD4SYC4_9MAGN|nr:hypothetical protein MKW98_024414 [Papaver atlanticum]
MIFHQASLPLPFKLFNLPIFQTTLYVKEILSLILSSNWYQIQFLQQLTRARLVCILRDMVGGVPEPLRKLGTTAGILFGGVITLSLASTLTIRALQTVSEAKRKKGASPCGVCRGKGFYICKLCKGNSTVEWSPLYDPVVINPCLCPTCEGNRVQRCLNCLGKGYC